MSEVKKWSTKLNGWVTLESSKSAKEPRPLKRQKKRTTTEQHGTFVCRACKGETFTPLSDAKVQEYAGTLPSGQIYNTILRTWVKCQNCDQCGILMQYRLDPE